MTKTIQPAPSSQFGGQWALSDSNIWDPHMVNESSLEDAKATPAKTGSNDA